jgi:hypothetical protein
MAFLINSAATSTSGTTGNDYFLIQSAAFRGTTVAGLAGNDTIEALAGNNGTAISINAAGGADLLKFSGGTISAGSVLAGAGGDSINFGKATTFGGESTIATGDGNDTLTIQTQGVFNSASILLGAGSDSATIDADITDSNIGLGSGGDKLAYNSGVTNSATVIGGGGADSIVFAAGGDNHDHMLVNGDSSANGGGADTITFASGLGTDSTIRGKGGKDVISLGSVLGASSQVLGNAGADSIGITKGISGAAVLIGGGSGNDTITMLNVDTVSTIAGGGGNDSIDITNAVTGAAYVIKGGMGADTIGLGTVFASGDVATTATVIQEKIAFDSFAESTLGGFDVYSAGTSQSGFSYTLSAAGVMTFDTGEVLAADAGIATTTTDGLIKDGEFETAGLTARVVALDASLTKKGSVVGFMVGTTQHIFIQGGASGTDDDLVTSHKTTILSGMTLGSFKIDFHGVG